VQTYGSLTIKAENVGVIFLGNPKPKNKTRCSKSHEKWIKHDKSKKQEISG
jgi:hypothetical protein